MRDSRALIMTGLSIENYAAELERFIDSRIRTERALHLPMLHSSKGRI